MKPLDTVALIKPISHSKIVVGQVGCIVSQLDHQTFEVKFVDLEGFTIDVLTLKEADLLALHFEEVKSS